MRSITKRKEHFDNFAWKILDILRKSKDFMILDGS